MEFNLDQKTLANIAQSDARAAFLLAQRVGALQPVQYNMTATFSESTTGNSVEANLDNQVQEDVWIYATKIHIYQPSSRLCVFKPLLDYFYQLSSPFLCELQVVGPGVKFNVTSTPSPLWETLVDCPIGWAIGYGYNMIGRFSTLADAPLSAEKGELPTTIVTTFRGVAMGTQRYASLDIGDCRTALQQANLLPAGAVLPSGGATSGRR